MSESALRADVLSHLSRGPVRLFRTHAGTAWQGTVIKQTSELLILRNPRPIRLGAPGISDLCGWIVENDVARYAAIELKYGTTRTSAEQLAFIDLVNSHGGRAGIARSVQDAARILGISP